MNIEIYIPHFFGNNIKKWWSKDRERQMMYAGALRQESILFFCLLRIYVLNKYIIGFSPIDIIVDYWVDKKN